MREFKLPDSDRVFTYPDRKGGFDFDWKSDRPVDGVNSDNFSTRLSAHRYLKGGTYRFKLTGDDGVRLFVNGEEVIDRWKNPPYGTPHEKEIILPEGIHHLQVEHSEGTGRAYTGLDWDFLGEELEFQPGAKSGGDIEPEVAATYEDLVKQWGASAVGAAIAPLTVQQDTPKPPPGMLAPAFMFPTGYIQELRGTNGPGAILKPTRSSPKYIFGKLWETYQKMGGWKTMGYPLASQKDLGNGAYELELPDGKLFWAPGMTNPTYYEYTNGTLTIPADSWRGEYFNNRDWAGSPAVVRSDSASGANLDKYWRKGTPPAPGMGENNFSVRWTTNRPFERGTYRFIGDHDDGFVVDVNGQKPIDEMAPVAAKTKGYGTFARAGQYPVEVKHREYGGSAKANLRMEKASPFVVGLDPGNRLSVELPGAFKKHGGYEKVGLPVNDVHPWGHGYVQDFNHGKNGSGILMRRHNTTVFYYIHGKIWELYRTKGRPDKLGYPTSDRFNDGQGNTAQEFEKNRITRRPNGETFIGGYVNGHRLPGDFYPVWKKYKGTIGNPKGGVQNYNGSQYILFDKGSIVSSKHGTFPLYGGIREYYLDTAGGLGGPLGAPKSGEYGWKGYTRQDFAGGYILWKSGQGAVGYRPDGSLLYPPPNNGGGGGGGSGNGGGAITSYPEYLKRLYGHGQGAITQYPHGDHRAIDSVNQGPYPYKVYALAGGKVIRKQIDRYGGLYIDIWNEQLQKTFRYLHFESFNPNLDVGEYVNAGDFIGIEGHSGYTIPEGPGGRHTHFAIVSNGVEIDPWPTLGSIPGGSNGGGGSGGGNNDGDNSGNDESVDPFNPVLPLPTPKYKEIYIPRGNVRDYEYDANQGYKTRKPGFWDFETSKVLTNAAIAGFWLDDASELLWFYLLSGGEKGSPPPEKTINLFEARQESAAVRNAINEGYKRLESEARKAIQNGYTHGDIHLDFKGYKPPQDLNWEKALGHFDLKHKATFKKLDGVGQIELKIKTVLKDVYDFKPGDKHFGVEPYSLHETGLGRNFVVTGSLEESYVILLSPITLI